MKGGFYRVLTHLSRRFGPWVFDLTARGIAAGYFFSFPARVAQSVRFYRAAFPQRTKVFHLWCAWRQFQNFTSVYLDRFVLQREGGIEYTFEGWERIEQAVDRRTGAVLLMSHQGNWEVAAKLMMHRRPDLPILLFMGIDEKEGIETVHRREMNRSGISILAVEKDGGSPFDIVEGIRFLQAGGLVALTGDRTWKSDQRTVRAAFFGHRVELPETPHLLALMASVPVLVFFSHKAGPRRYHFRIAGAIAPAAVSRRRRRQALVRSAQRYADLLAEEVRRHPTQWYHFEPFLGPRLNRPRSL